MIGDSDDPLIVAGELRDAIRDGRPQQRCEEIAVRAAAWDGLPADTSAIEVVTERTTWSPGRGDAERARSDGARLV